MCEKYINVHEAIGEDRSLLWREMWFASIFFAYNLFLLASSSSCPEPKKPHLTSCTIFYNCVNVPGGGYVWVPSRCNKGLVFQPYLRMCVIPGDIWTCDTLATEETVVTKKYDAIEHSGYTQDSGLSETIDSSYVIDDFSDPTTEASTAIPLIEFEESGGTTRGYEDAKNASCHREEGYLHNYVNTQEQMALSLTQRYKSIVDIHQKWLNEMMNRLHVYREVSAAISASLALPVKNITIINPTQTVTIFASHDHRKQNYPAHSGKPTKEDNKKLETGDIATTNSAASTESTLKLLIDSLDADNNVIRLVDDLGTKKYLTIEDYKAISYRLNPRHISVLMCTKNLRLANRTDCNRYYTCDPETASVIEHSCPPRTAFNANLRICDVESAKTCAADGHSTNEISVGRENATVIAHEESSGRKVCREIGKMKDPTSDSHYYICYSASGSEDIKSIRMTCPNTLIFCQGKKVCTTKRLCYASR